jgi:hypothetical protein
MVVSVFPQSRNTGSYAPQWSRKTIRLFSNYKTTLGILSWPRLQLATADPPAAVSSARRHRDRRLGPGRLRNGADLCLQALGSSRLLQVCENQDPSPQVQ